MNAISELATIKAFKAGTGIKHDSGKPPLSLIPRSALEAEGRVLAFGAKKYAPDNWRKGFAWRRLIDAALRHIHAIADGEDRDPDTGELHAAHARCMLAFLIEHQVKGLGVDDRHTAKKPAAEVRVPTTVGSATATAGKGLAVMWGAPEGVDFDTALHGPLTAGAPLGGVKAETDGFRTMFPRNLDDVLIVPRNPEYEPPTSVDITAASRAGSYALT